jgi:subfamily B ATP-binding cassette protein HlyB/CyaB
MTKIDTQRKSNDCGISVVKIIATIYNKPISKSYIEDNIALDEKGSRITDIRGFLNNNGFEARFQLLDLNHLRGNIDSIEDKFPFILPVKHRVGLHYVVVNGLKRGKFVVYDPAKTSEYLLSLTELTDRAHISKNYWDLSSTEDKLTVLCSGDLSKYSIDIESIINKNGNDLAVVFNKLTYFSYLKDNYGFKDEKYERVV